MNGRKTARVGVVFASLALTAGTVAMAGPAFAGGGSGCGTYGCGGGSGWGGQGGGAGGGGAETYRPQAKINWGGGSAGGGGYSCHTNSVSDLNFCAPD